MAHLETVVLAFAKICSDEIALSGGVSREHVDTEARIQCVLHTCESRILSWSQEFQNLPVNIPEEPQASSSVAKTNSPIEGKVDPANVVSMHV